MDFLRFLLRLPLMILRGIYWVISKIVGDMSWSAPLWMRATGSGLAYTGRGMRAHPGRTSVIVNGVNPTQAVSSNRSISSPAGIRGRS